MSEPLRKVKVLITVERLFSELKKGDLFMLVPACEEDKINLDPKQICKAECDAYVEGELSKGKEQLIYGVKSQQVSIVPSLASNELNL